MNILFKDLPPFSILAKFREDNRKDITCKNMIKGSARFGFKCLFKLSSEELDSEVAGINHPKKNKDHENTNKIMSEKDDSEVPEEDIIEEIIESEDNIGEKQDKEFPEKHVSSRSICSMLLSINQI